MFDGFIFYSLTYVIVLDMGLDVFFHSLLIPISLAFVRFSDSLNDLLRDCHGLKKAPSVSDCIEDLSRFCS